jgi:senataxin
LKTFEWTDLMEEILSARVNPLPSVEESEIIECMKTHDVNEPQAKAVLGALRNEGFSLIQG